MWWQVKHQRVRSKDSNLYGTELEIERRGDMETATASGRYVVKM
jgi:hypothetical protein